MKIKSLYWFSIITTGLSIIGVLLIFFPLFDTSFELYNLYLTWFSGICGYMSSIILFDKLNIHKFLFVVQTLSGLVWLGLPIFLIPYLAVPCLVTYSIVQLFIHIKINKR